MNELQRPRQRSIGMPRAFIAITCIIIGAWLLFQKPNEEPKTTTDTKLWEVVEIVEQKTADQQQDSGFTEIVAVCHRGDERRELVIDPKKANKMDSGELPLQLGDQFRFLRSDGGASTIRIGDQWVEIVKPAVENP